MLATLSSFLLYHMTLHSSRIGLYTATRAGQRQLMLKPSIAVKWVQRSPLELHRHSHRALSGANDNNWPFPANIAGEHLLLSINYLGPGSLAFRSTWFACCCRIVNARQTYAKVCDLLVCFSRTLHGSRTNPAFHRSGSVCHTISSGTSVTNTTIDGALSQIESKNKQISRYISKGPMIKMYKKSGFDTIRQHLPTPTCQHNHLPVINLILKTANNRFFSKSFICPLLKTSNEQISLHQERAFANWHWPQHGERPLTLFCSFEVNRNGQTLGQCTLTKIKLAIRKTNVWLKILNRLSRYSFIFFSVFRIKPIINEQETTWNDLKSEKQKSNIW